MTFESTAIVTVIYTACSAVRLLFYVPQMMAVARERSAAHAISLTSWTFWSISHAATAMYASTITNDVLLSAMMCGNAVGCIGIVAMTAIKRRRYGWSRNC